MPDENKFQKLREIGYRIGPRCGLCTSGWFSGNGPWGQCHKHCYEHKKHDNPDGGRGVSIHSSGVCGDFDLDQRKLARSGLGAHMEFFDDSGEEEGNGS